MLNVLLSLGLTVETVLFLSAAFAWLRTMDYTLAESGAGAIVLTFMAVSLAHQVSFWIGSPIPVGVLEATGVAASLFAGYRRRRLVGPYCRATMNFIRQERLSGAVAAATWTAMAALAMAGNLAASPLASNALAALVVEGNGYLGMAAAAPLPPLNAPALFAHTARFGLGPNGCGFGILAHMAIGCSTYALARRYAWPPMALTVTLMVLSMPRLVFLGLHPSAELISTVSVCFAVVLIYRLLEQPRAADMRLFLLCVLFGVHANPMSLVLVGVLLLLSTVVLIRRHGGLMLRALVCDRPRITAVALLPALLLAQLPVFLLNQANGYPLLGSAIDHETGGVLVAVVNLMRYLFVSVDLTQPVQDLLVWLVGLDAKAAVMTVYHFLAGLMGDHSALSDRFAPVFSGRGAFGWGPFTIMVVLPAMAHALLRGPRRLKAVSIAWLGYIYVAALVLRWKPGNMAVLSPIYAAGAFMVAFSLPAWRLRRRGMRILQVDFALLIAWSLLSCWRLHG